MGSMGEDRNQGERVVSENWSLRNDVYLNSYSQQATDTSSHPSWQCVFVCIVLVPRDSLPFAVIILFPCSTVSAVEKEAKSGSSSKISPVSLAFALNVPQRCLWADFVLQPICPTRWNLLPHSSYILRWF